MTDEPLHDVWIPALHRDLTDGAQRVQLPGGSVSDLIDELDARYPGMKARLCQADKLRPNISVSVNGTISHRGERQRLTQSSEVHFIPAMSGG